MKILKRTVIWIVILSVSFVCGVFLFMISNGKKLVEDVLKHNIGQQVNIKDINYQIPSSFKVIDVNIDGLLQAPEAYIYINLVSIFKKKITARQVIIKNPLINYGSTKKQDSKEAVVKVKENNNNTPTYKTVESNVREFIIEKLEIQNGEFSYIDLTKDKSMSSFKLEKLNIKANNISLTGISQRIDFVFSGIIKKNQSVLANSKAMGHGWINIDKRDMEANLTVVDEHEKMALKALVVSKENTMNVTGELNYNQYQLTQTKEEDKFGSNDSLLSALSTLGVDIGANFRFETKMDDFKIENVFFSGNVVTQ